MALGSRPKPGSTDCTCRKLRRTKPTPTSSSSEIVSLRNDPRVAQPELTGLTAPGAVAPEGAGDVR